MPTDHRRTRLVRERWNLPSPPSRKGRLVEGKRMATNKISSNFSTFPNPPAELCEELQAIHKTAVFILRTYNLATRAGAIGASPILWSECEELRSERESLKQQLEIELDQINVIASLKANLDSPPFTDDYLAEVKRARSEFTECYKPAYFHEQLFSAPKVQYDSANEFIHKLAISIKTTVYTAFRDLPKIPRDLANQNPSRLAFLKRLAVLLTTLPRLVDTKGILAEVDRELIAVQRLRDQGKSWQKLNRNEGLKELPALRPSDNKKITQALAFVRQFRPPPTPLNRLRPRLLLPQVPQSSQHLNNNFDCPNNNSDNQHCRDKCLGKVFHGLSALPSNLSKICFKIALTSAMSAL